MTESQDTPHSLSSADRLVRSEEEIASRASRTRLYSRYVRSLRLALPVAALAIVVVLMVWSDQDTAPIKAVPRDEISPQTASRNELVNPKFQSEDGDSQPYTITADKATQNAENMDMIHLDKPVADINLKSGNWVALKAVQGDYDQKSGVLQLNGDVLINHDTGYELQSQTMNINIDGQTMSSDNLISGHGPAGEISAQGLEADGKTDKVIFKGPAKLILRHSPASDPHSAPPSDKEPHP
ncbi:MAG: LPS export ABC transporter periplasmic protein LptC [Pseudobdellovibrionaceae bacterium]|nr:LPS export ABC transporter periplasmic protein LptC [Pseudobdellovibrionaceae bacterium]